MQDNTGHFEQCRASLDSGSQPCKLTEALSRRLNLPHERVLLPIVGTDQLKYYISSIVAITVKSSHNSYKPNSNVLDTCHNTPSIQLYLAKYSYKYEADTSKIFYMKQSRHLNWGTNIQEHAVSQANETN